MDRIKTTEGDVIVRDGRFAIVAARFNEFIVESLIKGSLPRDQRIFSIKTTLLAVSILHWLLAIIPPLIDSYSSRLA